MSRHAVEGSVYLNETLAYSDPSVFMSDRGTHIYPTKSDYSIPRIEIYWLRPQILVDMAAKSTSDRVSISLSGDYIGETSELSGYAAVDSGKRARPILEMHFSMKFEKDGFSISISGKAGGYISKTVAGAGANFIDSSSLNFGANFFLKDGDLPKVFYGSSNEGIVHGLLSFRNQLLAKFAPFAYPNVQNG